MRKITYILIAMVMMLTASCSDDGIEQQAPNTPVRAFVPVTLVTGQPMTTETRALGDPGYDDNLPPTQYLYAWAVYKTAVDKWSVEFKPVELENDNWTNDSTEQTGSHYTTKELGLSLPDVMDGDNVGKVYVVASNRKLTNGELHSICDTYSEADYTNGLGCQKNLSTQPALSDATFIPTDWTCLNLRDLYSNPNGDAAVDANGLGNGVIKKDGNEIIIGTIRLYHCAAKVDFKWEVAETLRSTTSVESITCTGLPTTLKVFEPTANDIGTGTSLVVGTDAAAVNALTPANKYIGRAYAYMLQPAAGTISYSVAFAGSANRQQKNATTEAAPTGIYTTWYRVIAEVKP